MQDKSKGRKIVYWYRWADVGVSTMTMVWCEKHRRALFLIIHDRLLATTDVLYQVFSHYGDEENIAQFLTMGDFHARVNLCSNVHAFCKLQGCQICEGCELYLHFASEVICGCKPYIPRYMLDYEP